VLPGRQVLLMLHVVLSLMRTKRFFTIKFVAFYTMVLLVDAQRDEAYHTCLLALIADENMTVFMQNLAEKKW
jgi:hypothetical protein